MSCVDQLFVPNADRKILCRANGRVLSKQPGVFEFDGFKVPGFLIKGSKRRLAEFVRRTKMQVGPEGMVAGKPVKVLVDETMPSAMVTTSPGHMLHDEQSLVNSLQDTLCVLSRITGVEFELIASDCLLVPPRVATGRGGYRKGYQFRIVLNASPPGAYRNFTGKTACGYDFEDDEAEMRFAGPALGRGVLVKDQDEVTVAQIIGETAYLFVPSTTMHALSLLAKRGLFKKLLRLAWNSHVAGVQDTAITPIKNQAGYHRALGELDLEYPGLFAVKLKEVDAELDQLRLKMTSLLEHKKALRVQFAAFVSGHFGTKEERFESWKEFRKNRAVKRIEWRTGAFQFYTRNIICEYDGVRYDFGTFGARLESLGRISVWSESPTHPMQIAHPHISKEGSVCFGNIDFELRELMAEGRMADAAALVVRWLEEGYDPALADTKIETWPLAGAPDERQRRQLLASAQDPRPSPAPTHRRVRGRGGRKHDRVRARKGGSEEHRVLG